MGNGLQWFRLYAEIVNDPKVMTLPEAMRWRLVAFMALRCAGQFPAESAQIAWALRMTAAEVDESLDVFRERGFLDESGDFRNWDKRQYVSDSSTQRVRKHRQRNHETLQERSGNGGVTPSEQNRTEQIRTEQNKTEPLKAVSDEDAKRNTRRLIEEARRIAGCKAIANA